MKWKAAILGPIGEAHVDTYAFRLLYSFPTRADAEAHAECLRSVSTKIVECDEQGNPANDSRTVSD